MEMLEKIGRAIAEAENYAYDPVPYDRYARAALEAMREPTEAMVKAGDLPGWDDSVTVGHSAEVWQAMIDAALSPSGEK